ncbi:hypothetical protein A2335_00010 [Candidatus Peregrinibacteria bacterium RIFOXYB2_FULL_32_7]|nr:MAG: hypothetical protein A2335_00010 [Candidatus Peregrinibacteria bacterium RIFOXYB2_FULL_32_7]
MDFSQLLRTFNFTDHEITVYEYLLKSKEPLCVKQIANGVKIDQSTVFRIMPRFMEKNLCEEMKIGRYRCYVAKINNELRPFLLLKDKNLIPETEFFFGEEEMKKLYYETITGEPIYAFVNLDNLYKNLTDFVQKDYVPNRCKSRTKAYVIASPFSFADNYAKEGVKYLRQTKICKEIFDYGELNIYGDNVVFLSVRPHEPLGLHIKNPFLAHCMKSMFDVSWKLM